MREGLLVVVLLINKSQLLLKALHIISLHLLRNLECYQRNINFLQFGVGPLQYILIKLLHLLLLLLKLISSLLELGS